jgi:hypothetical protein
LCGSFPNSAAAQAPESRNLSSINVESSPQLFAIMCALAAAGFDSESAALAATPAQEQLREDLLKLQGPAVDALRQFYRQHQMTNARETFSPYISFALVVGPPPKFSFLLNHDQLPPDVLGLEGFDEVLVNFYREAQIERRWRGIQPEYEKGIQRFDSPVRRIVTLSTAYLREILTPSQRTFTLYVEPMVGPRTNFRNYLDHYDVVVNPSPVLPLDDIRHAFLHFLLDPLPLKFDALVLSKKALLNFAARAPRLPVEYQRDFTSLFSECLIRAVELRLTRQSPAQLEAALVDADRSGFVLVRPLVDQLKKFEKAEPAMHYYFPDLVRGIDVAAEEQRLQKVEFAAAGESAAPSQLHAHSGETELDRLLTEGDRQIALQNGAAAAEVFEHILQKYPDVPRAVYGLAVASVLQRNGDRAKELFEKLVKPAAVSASGSAPPPVEPDVLAWSHVYLGRIHDVEGDRNLALIEYRAALGVEGAPEAARVAAQRGVSTGYQPKRPVDDSKRP